MPWFPAINRDGIVVTVLSYRVSDPSAGSMIEVAISAPRPAAWPPERYFFPEAKESACIRAKTRVLCCLSLVLALAMAAQVPAPPAAAFSLFYLRV